MEDSLALRLTNAAIRGVLLVVLPLLLAAVFMRYFVPTPSAAAGTFFAPIASLGHDYAALLFIALFVAFSAVAGQLASVVAPPAGGVAKRGGAFGTFIIVGFGAAAALLLRGSVGSFRVQGTSMLPTLEPEDVVDGRPVSVAAGSDNPRGLPARGDIVVFERPGDAGGARELVKRVIGLPGDRITMNGGHPVINGWEVPSCDAGPYFYPLPDGGGIVGRLYVEFLDGRAHLMIHAQIGQEWRGPYDVRPGEVFVLGDDRNNSNDSRAWNDGAGAGLPVEALDARVERWLFGLRRDDRVDLSHLLRPLELFVRLDGMDTGVQRDGIAHCLAERPANTTPPRPQDTGVRAAERTP